MIVREKMYPPQLSPEFVDFLSGRSGNWEEGGKGWEVELTEEEPGGNPGWFEFEPGNGSQLNPPWSAGSNLGVKKRCRSEMIIFVKHKMCKFSFKTILLFEN